MVVDGQPHIVDMLKLPTRTSTPEAVAVALAAVLEAAGVPAVGTMVATQQDGRGQVETYEVFGDMVMCRIVLPDDPDCACILLDLTEARALRGVEEGDQ